MLEVFGPKVVGAQLSEVGTVGATRLSVAVTETLLSVAVMVAFWLTLSAPVVAAKVAVVEPAATVTVAGTLRKVLVLESATEAPPLGAARLSVTVQVLDAFGPMFLTEQVSIEGVAVPTVAPPRAVFAVTKRATPSKGAKLLFNGSFLW